MKVCFFAILLVLLNGGTPSALGQLVPELTCLQFTTIEIPGADVTWVNGINNTGDMVGNYISAQKPFGAFLLSGGKLSLFRYKGDSTSAQGINDSGLITGWIGVGESVGFTYDGTNFRIINVPGRTYTIANRINNAGDIVGAYATINGTAGYKFRNGRFQPLIPPGMHQFALTGINSRGDVVGYTDTHATIVDVGFSFIDGKYQIIQFPGSVTTLAQDINDAGIIVGWYFTPAVTPSGFVLMNGKYFALNFPGANYTLALGINNLGQIVGTYSGLKSGYQGFVTSPIPTSGCE